MIEYPQGTPSWVALSSPDLDASALFYGELLGWELAPAEETDGYRKFNLGGKSVAGLGSTQEGQSPAWTTYIAVDDAAAIKDRVEAAGGSTVTEPFPIRDAGTLAVFTDGAGGASFSVWQAGRHRGAQLVNAPGALSMNELATRDFDGAFRFYGAVFGWTVEPIELNGQLVYGSVKLDDRLVAGVLPMGPQFPAEVSPHWVPYFGVEDLDGSAARAERLGAHVLMGPTQVPAGRFVVLRDPHGAVFSIFQGSYDPPPGA